MKRPPLLVLAGPTAVGKTGLAIALAQALGGEIVGADSVQVYRGLDIGSAKPTAGEQAQAKHHLIDVAEPQEEFSAARYAELASEAVDDIAARGRRALVVGGTGLYIKALLFGLAPAPPVDQELRIQLQRDWESQGAQAMHLRLAKLDPVAARRLHQNDRQRVLRALEATISGGRPFSQQQEAHGFKKSRYPHLYLGLERPREELNQRIEQRSRQMWQGGLLQEVEGLLQRGVSPRAASLQSLGYRQAAAVLQGEMEPEQGLLDMIKRTKAYAKRQLTWFRGVKSIKWHRPQDLEGILARARNFFGTDRGK